MERWANFSWSDTLDNSQQLKIYDHEQDIININLLLAKHNLRVDEYIDSPTITTYIINLNVDSKINTILRLEKNFQIAVNDNNVRVYLDGNKLCIEKKGADNIVNLRRIIPDGFIGKKEMIMSIGLDNTGNPVCYDLNKAPHELIAGTTGSGKSALLRQLFCSLLINHYDDTEFYGIDPKGTEFSIFRGLQCFKYISETSQAIAVLQELCDVMDARYKVLQAAGARDIDTYNQIGNMKHIVCIIDEFADLMMTSGSMVEDCVVRLAQKARAAGIHLIIATQRPTADVITGLIKANIPTRIALKVVSGMESRIILDRKGAEKLNGKGDMLFLPNGAFEPIRVQGALISDREIDNLFVKAYIEAGGHIDNFTVQDGGKAVLNY